MNTPCDTNNAVFEISNGLYCGFNDGKVVTENERNSRNAFDTLREPTSPLSH